MSAIKQKIANYFQFAQRETNFSNEIRGGIVTFLTMSYILLVNPHILSTWIHISDDVTNPRSPAPTSSLMGLPQEGGSLEMLFSAGNSTANDDAKLHGIYMGYVNNIATSTAAVCGLATLLVGVIANVPFAIGPGMGMNTFFVGSITTATSLATYPAAKLSWDAAITNTLLAGLIIFLLSIFKLSSKIIALLPALLKSAIMVGIGVYQAFVGLRSLKLIQDDPDELLKAVDTFNFANNGSAGPVAQILFCIGLLLISILHTAGVKASILVGISVITVICWIGSLAGVKFPWPPIELPVFDKTFADMNFKAVFAEKKSVAKNITTILSFVLITLFDVGGVMFGVMSIARPSAMAANAIEKCKCKPATTTTTEAEEEEGVLQKNRSEVQQQQQQVIPWSPISLLSGSEFLDTTDKNDDEDEAEGEIRRKVLAMKKRRRKSSQKWYGQRRAQHGGVSENSVAEQEEDRVIASEITREQSIDFSVLDKVPEVISPKESLLTFSIIGFSSMFSALLGCSPCIVFLECAAGVASGARTGFASVITSLIFFLSVFLVPLFRSVPLCASSPALLLIGCFMMSSVTDIPWKDHKLAMPAFLTIILMPMTASITPGIAVGILSYIFLNGSDYVIHWCVENISFFSAKKNNEGAGNDDPEDRAQKGGEKSPLLSQPQIQATTTGSNSAPQRQKEISIKREGGGGNPLELKETPETRSGGEELPPSHLLNKKSSSSVFRRGFHHTSEAEVDPVRYQTQAAPLAQYSNSPKGKPQQEY